MALNGTRGLSSQKARELLRQHGENALEAKRRRGAFYMFICQFKDLLILILAAATVFSAAIGEYTEAVSIVAILLLNAVMGFLQEYRTERVIESLSELSAPEARAYRDGRLQKLPARELVPGDLIAVSAGDRIPADCRLLSAAALSVDESMLTGESNPVEKREGQSIFMGTLACAGRGEALVEATGMNTEMGSIAKLVEDAGEQQTPLQKKLSKLGGVLAVLCGLICLAVIVLGTARGEPFMQMVLTGVSLAVAAIPEGLPAIVTVVLALSVGRILKKGAVIRRLHAVETLGSATVICSDKTGTITQNRMAVQRVWSFGGYGASGSITLPAFPLQPEEGAAPAADNPAIPLAMTAVTVCSAAEVRQEGGELSITGSPTEAALAACAVQSGLAEPRGAYRVLLEQPFDSRNKMMWVRAASHGGERSFAKGAPEVLLAACSSCMAPGGRTQLTAALRREIMQAADAMAAKGMRVLAAAMGEGGKERLCFLALFGIIDPPRPEVKGAVAACRRAGIRPVMITGDHELTAEAVAKSVGILREGAHAVTGQELDGMSDRELLERVQRSPVFARVSPAHKLRIVRVLRASGETVAMTGDGVNDAPALKESDVGIAMGISGTDVTKEAAAAVILDDNFATIVSAVTEGRIICRNIRRFVKYMLGSNLGEVVTVLAGMVFRMPVIFLPIQILFINLVTDGFPALALGMDGEEEGVMSRPPRPADESLLSGGMLAEVSVRGLMLGLLNLTSFSAAFLLSGGSLEISRSAALLTLVLAQMIYVFECAGGFRAFKGAVLPAAFCSLALVLAAIYLPPLQGVFSTGALRGPCLAAALLPALLSPLLGAAISWAGKDREL